MKNVMEIERRRYDFYNKLFLVSLLEVLSKFPFVESES